jgi:hypothetical protein
MYMAILYMAAEIQKKSPAGLVLSAKIRYDE